VRVLEYKVEISGTEPSASERAIDVATPTRSGKYRNFGPHSCRLVRLSAKSYVGSIYIRLAFISVAPIPGSRSTSVVLHLADIMLYIR
jgi:hypothetical protein